MNIRCVRVGVGGQAGRWVAPFATSPEVFVIGASAWGSRGRSGSGGRVIMTTFGGFAREQEEMQGNVGRE